MFVSESNIRVLYADTDKMGFVYYGNYPKYYEFGRTEAFRDLGIAYSEMERMGIAMPVIHMNVVYKKPAFYDDLLTVRSLIKELPETRIRIEYQVFNQNKELLNIGETTLIFLDLNKNRPVRVPEYLIEKIRPYFEADKV